MNKTIFLLLFIFTSISFSSTKTIDKRIKNNTSNLNISLTKKKETSRKVKDLAYQIDKQNKNIMKLEKNIKEININSGM